MTPTWRRSVRTPPDSRATSIVGASPGELIASWNLAVPERVLQRS